MKLSCLFCGVSIIYGQIQPIKYCFAAADEETEKAAAKQYFNLDLSNGFQQEKVSSAGSVCNTRTKHRKPGVINLKTGDSDVL